MAITITYKELCNHLPCERGYIRATDFAKVHGKDKRYNVADLVGCTDFVLSDFTWLAGRLNLYSHYTEFVTKCTLIYLEQVESYICNSKRYYSLVKFTRTRADRPLTPHECDTVKRLLSESNLLMKDIANLTNAICRKKSHWSMAYQCLPPQTTPAVLTLLKKVFTDD